MPTLIISPIFQILMPILGVLSVVGLLYSFYVLVFAPVWKALGDEKSPPPEAGSCLEILLSERERLRTVSVGQLDSDVCTRLDGISEDHLVLKFKKEVDLEEYDISVIPGGKLFYRAPHTKSLEPMQGTDTFASYELIGHPATFQLIAGMRGDKPIRYVEFELRTIYIITTSGADKMKFILELKSIHPGVDTDSRNRRGVYQFGTPRQAEPSEEAESESE